MCLIAACGGGEKSVKIFPDEGDVEIMGKLKNNVVLSNKIPATLTLKNNSIVTIKIPLELIEPVTINLNKYEFYIAAEVYDENGKTIQFDKNKEEFAADNHCEKENLSAIEEFKAFLSKKQGTKMDLEIELVIDNPFGNIEELLSKAKTYVLECEIYEKREGYFDSEDDDIDDEPSFISDSSEDWDAVLKSYEEFIDKYIALLKKANQGDMSALTEYVNMMEKASDLAEKLGDANDELTPEQAAKFLKLQTKFTNAALSM